MSSWQYEAWHCHAKEQNRGALTEAFFMNGLPLAKYTTITTSVTMVKEIQKEHMFMVSGQFAMVLLIALLPVSILG